MKAPSSPFSCTGSICWKAALILAVCGVGARADVSLRNGNMAAAHGSGTPGSVAAQTSTAATVAAQQAAQVAANAQAATQRSLQALQALQAAQGAARQTALASGVNNLGFNPNNPSQQLPNVPDGIATGGLMPAGGTTPTQNGATTSYTLPSSWQNVQSLTQTSSGGHVADTVTQSGQQALLYWTTFNVGRNTTLSFDQSAGGANVDQWVAINEIKDPSLYPSQILGSIQAQGQVYVLNQNGIIFGGSSQVNVHTLVASSLALDPDYITNGLLNNAQNNYEFQFSALESAITQINSGITTVAPLWTAPGAASGTTQTVFAVPTGDITVQAGAQLSSPTDENHDGGRIALIAPNVVNHGTISTPDGQTILAAGEQVGLAAHASTDPTLRGLDVFIGPVSAASATLANGSTFTFNGLTGNEPLADNSGLPGSEELTFSGTGVVGSYTTPAGTVTSITGGASTTIPLGSQVTLTGGSASFAAAQGGVATNAGNVVDGQGNIISPGGDIEAPRADVTMAGRTINQLGIINDSTSVTLNGRIDLLANYNAQVATFNEVTTLYPQTTGTVTLGSQSVTQILPELSDGDTAVGTQLALSSLVNVQALTITMQPGSLLYAPSAGVPADASTPAVDAEGEDITSGVSFDAGTWYVVNTSPGLEGTVFSYSEGNILLETNSIIDVSGSENVADSVTQNIVSAQLRGPELADSTLQQNGPLRGDTVLVNLQDTGVYDGTPWIGTPLGDVSGYVNDIEYTVGQLTTHGGSVALNAGTAITTDPGSLINVSGGYINYAGGFVQTSKVIEQDGTLIDISQAEPSVVYQGIYQGYTESSVKYGISQTFTSSLLTGAHFETGYLQGGSGGTISLTAPAITLGATLEGNTVTGPQQQTPIAALASTYAGATFLPVTEQVEGLPAPSTFDLSFFQLSADDIGDVYAATSPNVSFVTDATLQQTPPSAGQLFLSQDLVNTEGFGNVGIDTSASGTITVASGVSLVAPFGGDLSFLAANIEIDGSVATPGQGSMSFKALDVSPQTGASNGTPTDDPSRGNIFLAPGAALSADGLLVSDQAGADVLPMALNGGSISIAALDVDLSPGSSIDVSGGAALLRNKSATYGNAGTISILGGADPVESALVNGGSVIIGSTLSGYSGKVGGAGTLKIQAPLVQIGGGQIENGDNSGASFVAGEPGVLSDGTTLWFDSSGQSDFFSQGGFGNFVIEGVGLLATDNLGHYVFDLAGDPVVDPAVLITAGTTIKPVIQISRASMVNDQPNLAPLSLQQTASLLPSQRSAFNLTLDAEGVTSGSGGPPLPGGGTYLNELGAGGLLVRGDLVMEQGATIETDPQTNSANGVQLLASKGTVAVLGSIIAPGGSITIEGGNTSSVANNKLLFYESSPDQPFPTVDLGPNSLLSTAGATEQSFNQLGYYTGSVLNGGHVTIGGNIVAESGSVIDVAGATDVLEELPVARNVAMSTLLSTLYAPMEVDSNGGSITLNAAQMLFSDATLLGQAGGPSAQGGSLSVSSQFAATLDPSGEGASPLTITLVVDQHGLYNGGAIPAGYGTGLAVVRDEVNASPITTATGDVDSLFIANPNLFVESPVDASASDNGGRAGGFTTLSLAGTVDFQGAVTLPLADSLSIGLSSGNATSGETGGVIYADSNVVLSAPYIALNLNQSSYLPDVLPANAYPAASGGPGNVTIDAPGLVDVGNMSFENVSNVAFNSGGSAGAIRGDGTLQVDGTANLNASQIYPSTEATFTLEATTLDITAPAGQQLPALPISGGGTLNLEATTIDQAGVLRAPLGTINLGTSSTQNVILGPGSITSVSAVDPRTGLGLVIPYGIVDSSGDWYDPQGNDITVAGNGAGGVPAKVINITSQNIDAQAGSTIDVTGGGDLLAYGFLPGTGGNTDILASSGAGYSSNSFAVIPGYNVAYAPVGTFAQSQNLETNGVADVGYFNSSLAVGEQIHLDGGGGLPAGTYTLLPARYALLPGAYLVTATTSRPMITSLSQPDGSTIVAGYVTSGLNSTATGLYSSFEVDPQSVVLARAPYSVSLADSFFATSAAENEIAVPRLPQDAGQVVLDASASMTLAGVLRSPAAPGGLGGEVDIASPEAIYIVGSSEAGSVPAGSLALDASQLTDFGAQSLLIGGYRTNSDQGTLVTVTTSDLVVNDAGAVTDLNGQVVAGLGAPDLTLVSNGALALDAGSEIEQVGGGTSDAETLILGGTSGNEPSGSGDGVLVRVSGDSQAQIVRNNVNSADTVPNLSIGASASIQNANGGPVGALILDSTAGLSVATNANLAPVLSGNTLTLDSGSINIELAAPATAPTSGLVITNSELQSLLASTQSLAFLSYSSIALFGSGEIGGVTADGYQEGSLALHADDIYYGDTANSSGIVINAQNVSIDNLAAGSTLPSLTGLGTSSLTINTQALSLGSGAVRLDQFTSTSLNAENAILLRGLGIQTPNSDTLSTPASLTAAGALTLTAPLITNAAADRSVTTSTTSAVDESITATGALTLQTPVGAPAPAIAGGRLDAALALTGSTVDQSGGEIVLPSGSLALTASSGSLTVNSDLNVAGIEQSFYGLNKFTPGGQITLSAPAGGVTLGTGSSIQVEAASGLGTVDSMAASAGSLTISAPTGTFTVNSAAGALDGNAGEVLGSGGSLISEGTGGTFTLDASQLTGTNLSPLETLLTTTTTVNGDSSVSGFTGSQTIRLRDQSLSVNGVVAAQNVNLSVDAGSIEVDSTGRIVATAPQADGIDTTVAGGTGLLANPGLTGGTISLAASGSVTLDAGSLLTVAAQTVDDAGEGGAISLAAGSETVTGGTSNINPNGYISIASGALLDLRVLQTNTSLDGSAISGVTGTLNLRAPQILSGGNATGIQVNPVLGTIVDASTITVEGYRIYQPAGGIIDSVESQVVSDGEAFSTTMGTGTPGLSPLFSSAELEGATPAVNIEPGAELINPSGNLVLQQSWDLSTARFGVNNLGQALPGVLTLRAGGNVDIDFGASLNDGFNGATYEATLLDPGSLSWSYNIVSGADLSATGLFEVKPLASLAGSGSLLLGYQTGSPNILSKTSASHDNLNTFFQTIRTGTGNINVAAGGNVELLNNLATIYTAGTQVDPTMGGLFVQPNGTDAIGNPLPATYSEGGGNVAVTAQGNIAHFGYAGNGSTALVADSSAEMPTNWLDREGNVSTAIPTSWWVDVTNYFEGIGALGGGNVNLNAGGSVINVDADVPSNAREVNGQLTELGGGDLVVRAGDNIDGGVYYVERGQGSLSAGNNVQTNSTRAAVNTSATPTQLDWLPTTLFLGEGRFATTAGGNLLVGPVANPFLLPQSYNNVIDQQDLNTDIAYFSTYAAQDSLDATSLSGLITIQVHADTGQGSLADYYENILDSPTTREISDAETWLKLAPAVQSAHSINNLVGASAGQANGSPGNVYGGLGAILPPTVRITAFSSDVDLIGTLSLLPSATGTLDLAAAGSINGFLTNVITAAGNTVTSRSAEAVIDVSDANPAEIPSPLHPDNSAIVASSVGQLFGETGATNGVVLQTKELLHADINGGPLHANDSDPVYLVADNGSISGLTAYTPKLTDVIAGTDLTDVGLYVQNDNADDISVVEAGRDILAYDLTSPLRIAAGNNLVGYEAGSSAEGAGPGAPNSGDIQISGPGTLEVLAGRNLTLGNDQGQNPNDGFNGDGLFTGLTSVGDERNPALPFAGADLIAAAGLGAASGSGAGLPASEADFDSFVSEFLVPGSLYSATYLPDLATALGLSGESDAQTWATFESLPQAQRDAAALQVFYLVLRDAGRDHNDPASPGYGTYAAGYDAISALFPSNEVYGGSINLTSREAATTNGGNIEMLIPGGKLTVGIEVTGTSALDQGILTVDGGNISIFAEGDVNVGSSRIFTLHGGNEIIWSSTGNIDAGASSKTVVSAPPTRVVVDPTSGDVETDLGGLATGGGIGVLASIAGVPPGDVDLIAPEGVVDAGDAGIRATGNLNIAAVQVLNASNISVGGKSSGVPASSSVNLGAITAGSSVAGSSQQAATTANPSRQNTGATMQQLPSLITVEVIGYGGGDTD